MRQPGIRRTQLTLAAVAVTGLVLTLAPFAAASPSEESARSTAVIDWNEAAGRAAVAACIAPFDDPLHESRMYAMTHLAIHAALNAIDRRYEQYATEFQAPRLASVDATVAAAARDVLVSVISALPDIFPQECRDAGIASVEADYVLALADIADGTRKSQGVAAGQQAAAGVLALRTGDGSDVPVVDEAFPQGTEPGEWRFTPDVPFAFGPRWSEVVPFGVQDARQFRVPGPYALTSARYARDFVEVRRLGGDGIGEPTARSPRQTEIALFWLESSPLAWNRIARDLARSAGLGAWEQARLFALLDMSLADGYVSSFATKYDTLFWRPVTAIREAATDGNPLTSPGPAWSPLATTPPIPDHDSAHSVEGGAAAAVFRAVFGTDRFRFTACSLTVATGTCGQPGEVRHYFNSFSAAAAENANSRVLIGFHFRRATDVGLDHGRAIGGYVAATQLGPVR